MAYSYRIKKNKIRGVTLLYALLLCTGCVEQNSYTIIREGFANAHPLNGFAHMSDEELVDYEKYYEGVPLDSIQEYYRLTYRNYLMMKKNNLIGIYCMALQSHKDSAFYTMFFRDEKLFQRVWDGKDEIKERWKNTEDPSHDLWLVVSLTHVQGNYYEVVDLVSSKDTLRKY